MITVKKESSDPFFWEQTLLSLPPPLSMELENKLLKAGDVNS